MFASFANEHHHDGRIALWCAAPLGVQEMLVRDDPDTFFAPPYVGPKGWIGVVLDRCGDDVLRGLVEQAYGEVCAVRRRARRRSSR
jgi:hypothetical protein